MLVNNIKKNGFFSFKNQAKDRVYYPKKKMFFWSKTKMLDLIY